MSVTPDQCAREVLDVAPLVMRAIRTEMRSSRGVDLTVPQFRALAFVSRTQGPSLSDVANHIGLTPPSMSKLISGLVARGLVRRLADPGDRRRLTLVLTPRGRAALRAARNATRAHLAVRLSALSAAERATVVGAMRALHPVFAPGWAAGLETIG